MFKGEYFTTLQQEKVQCTLCPHKCVLAPDNAGKCHVRKNLKGELYNLQFGYISALHLDPIEKKPLYHFHPGSKVLSVGGYGCNMSCQFCQNHCISQSIPNFSNLAFMHPEQLAAEAKAVHGNIGLAYTYNEPIVNIEFIKQTALLVRQMGLKNILVTNGYIQEKPLLDLIPLLDAVNVDLKGFTNEFYKKYTQSALQPVKRSIQMLVEAGVHTEVTWLLIPDANDNQEYFLQAVEWLASLKQQNIVLHISGYHPDYKMKNQKTTLAQLQAFYQLAKRYLKFVYLGNVDSEIGNDTYCEHCGGSLIKRSSYKVEIKGIKSGVCKKCNQGITGFIF